MTSARSKAAHALNLGNRIAPARFVMFLALLPAFYLAYQAVVPTAPWKDALAVSFDVSALVFLASLIPLMRDDTPKSIREHAAQNDANRGLILAVTSVLTVVVMAAITG